MTPDLSHPAPDDAGSVLLAVQLLMATVHRDRVVLDCALVQEVRLGASRRIPAGVVFTLSIEHRGGDVGWSEHHAVRLLERWCESGAVVRVAVSWWSSCVVLRHDSDELLLAVC